jgi:Ca2+-binding RTX toxin-like protein
MDRGISGDTRRLGATAAAAMALVVASLGTGPVAGAQRPTCMGATATVVGSKHRDRIHGTPYRDVIDARGGNDVIVGNGGRDRVCGRPGRDSITGGVDSDRLEGGSRDDRLTAKNGDDLVVGVESKAVPSGRPARSGRSRAATYIQPRRTRTSGYRYSVLATC